MSESAQHAPSPDKTGLVRSPFYGLVPLDFLVPGEIHPCPYLPENTAREEVFKAAEFPPELYHDFMNYGFRRSGMYFYRPACEACNECRPVRVLAGEYRPTKSHRRILGKNHEVEVRIASPRFTKDKFRIYSDYLASQHGCGSDCSADSLRSFLYTSPVRTIEFEYRLRRRLLAVGIVDICSRSLSSVYAFYDPDFSSSSLGTFSAIKEILFCREHNIPHYYLGFLVTECPSMNYKARFKPHEILDKSFQWVRSANWSVKPDLLFLSLLF
ncbi:MAG: arginyltransferase [Desulfomonilaceae bacterium]